MKRKILLYNILLISLTSCNTNKEELEKSNVTVEECFSILSDSFESNNCKIKSDGNNYYLFYDRTSPIADLYNNEHGSRKYLKQDSYTYTSYDDNNNEIDSISGTSTHIEEFYYNLENNPFTNTYITDVSNGDNYTYDTFQVYDSNASKNMLIKDSSLEKTIDNSIYNFNLYPYQAKYELFDGLSGIVMIFLGSFSNLVSSYEYPDGVIGINNPTVVSGNKKVILTKSIDNDKVILKSKVTYTDYICTHTSSYQDTYEEEVEYKYNINQEITFTLQTNKIISINMINNYTLDTKSKIQELGLHQHNYSTNNGVISYTYSDDITNMKSIPSNLENYIDNRKSN